MHQPENTLLPVVILISGRGSNMQAIIEAVQQHTLALDIRAVISNRPAAAGLTAASRAGIATAVIDHNDYADREAFDRALQVCIDRYQPRLVILAGFMRILTTAFVEHYRGHMLNIHPSLLPALPGLHTHQRALDAAAREHGASIHFVTADMDGGPVILQARLTVRPDDDADRLAERVLQLEHRLYPEALRWFAAGRLALDENGDIRLDGVHLASPVQLAAGNSTDKP